jgi:hypothetical protein
MILTGITHSLVVIPTEEYSNKHKLIAIVSLYFGQGNNSINGIKYIIDGTGHTAWQTPAYSTIDKNGEVVNESVFSGDLLLEVCKLAAQSISRIKKEFGRPKWNTNYSVLKDKVTEIGEK